MFAPGQTSKPCQATPFRLLLLFLFAMKRRRLGLRINGKAKVISFIDRKLPQNPIALSFIDRQPRSPHFAKKPPLTRQPQIDNIFHS